MTTPSTSSGLTRREILKRGAVVGGAALVWTAPSAQAFAMTTATGQPGSLNLGCTPGFWKNHPEAWPTSSDMPINPSDTLGQFFDLSGGATCDFTQFNNATLLTALSWPDNEGNCSTLECAAQILLKHAVALMLNVETFYGASLRETEVVRKVEAALGTCDRQKILEQKWRFEELNQRSCPWSSSGGWGA